MKKYFFIGLGGFLGAATRVVIKGASIFNGTSFPIDTLLIKYIFVYSTELENETLFSTK